MAAGSAPDECRQGHHYITKSRAEWAAKVSRGQADGTVWRREDEFNSYQGDVFDDSASHRGPQVRAMLARSAEQDRAGYVSLARSTLSELTPSRRWTRQAMRRLRDGSSRLDQAEAWHLAIQVDEANLHRPCRMNGQSDEDGRAIFALLVADLKAQPLAPASLGRPFLCYCAEAGSADTLLTVVRGVDASGRYHEHRRQLPIKPGTTLGVFILSPRTMIAEGVGCDLAGSRHGHRVEHQAFSFL